MHSHVKGFEVHWCQHNLPYTGLSFVSNLIHKPQKNILAHNTALVASGNSGLPCLNSSRKLSDITLPNQSSISVNPMWPITLSFGKKCYNVTTPGDNLQISSTKRASIECMFLPRRLGSLHEGYFPDLIDQHDQHSWSTGIHVNETSSHQSARAAWTKWSAWRCLTCK